MPNLTALEIKTAPPGTYSDGDGLRLFKRENGGKWEWRYQFMGKRRDMGLGAWPAVSLKEARQERDKWAAVRRSGKDPLTERNAQREAIKAAMDKHDPSLATVANETLEAKRDGLRGGGSRGRWLSPIEIHIIPHMGTRKISEITQHDIYNAVKPIWRTKHPTAKKVIERLRVIFYHAQMAGVDCDPVTIDRAKHMLGEVKIAPVNHAAIAWQEAPAVFAKLSSTPSGQVIRFLMLTVVRSTAARGAMFSEIEGDVWTVPKDRIKGAEGKVTDFRVPLSAAALDVVEQCRLFGSDYVFPSPSARSGISDVGAAKQLKIVAPGMTIHGLRSTFRTWVQDTAQPWDVAETVLGHSIGNKVERAYARSDLLDQRRVLLQKWADFLTQESAKVVKIRG
jgi:integrase